jgi:branched-chain amino acid transport system permease protein
MVLARKAELLLSLFIAGFIFLGSILTYVVYGADGFSIFIFNVINSLVIGGVYALTAFGLSLVWGVMNLCNFAHGDFYTLAAYVQLWFIMAIGLNPIASALTSLLFVFALGPVLERSLLRPAYYSINPQYAWLITFGLSLFLQNLFLNIFGPFPKKPPSLFFGKIDVFGLYYPNERAMAGLIAAIIVVALYFMLKYTWYGRALRALVQDRETASLFGVNVSSIMAISFGLGLALAGISGLLVGPFLLIDPTAGFRPGLKAFVIVVLGGMGSLKGSVFGAMILALLETFGAAYISPGYQDAFGFLLLILTLIFKPEGLFGKEL